MKNSLEAKEKLETELFWKNCIRKLNLVSMYDMLSLQWMIMSYPVNVLYIRNTFPKNNQHSREVWFRKQNETNSTIKLNVHFKLTFVSRQCDSFSILCIFRDKMCFRRILFIKLNLNVAQVLDNLSKNRFEENQIP